jgi:hypothetical protein
VLTLVTQLIQDHNLLVAALVAAGVALRSTKTVITLNQVLALAETVVQVVFTFMENNKNKDK